MESRKPPDRDLTPLPELVAKIESFTPPAFASERKRLWQKLATALTAADSSSAKDILTSVLHAVVLAHEIRLAAKADAQKRSDEDSYWRERAALERQLADLSEHPLIRHFPSLGVRFYEPGEVKCPHGRHRKKCEWIRCRVEQWGQMTGLALLGVLQALGLLGPPAAGVVSGGVLFWPTAIRRANEVAQELAAAGVDPSKVSPDDFCPLPLPASLPSGGGVERRGCFMVLRETKLRWQAKLKAVKHHLSYRLHLPTPEQSPYLRAMVRGHGAPRNSPTITAFRKAAARLKLWWWTLRRSRRHPFEVVEVVVGDNYSSPLPPPLPPQRKGGRPHDTARDFLVEVVVGSLTEHGLSVERSAEFLQRILALCLGEEVDAAALVRRRHRLQGDRGNAVEPPLSDEEEAALRAAFPEISPKR